MARTLQAWFDRADELSADGRYFDAHEELEEGWKAASGDEKILLQGLIQIAAGLHRLKLDPSKTDGALYLFDHGLEKLERAKSLLLAQPLAALKTAIGEIRSSGKAPESLTFGLKACGSEK